MAFHFRSFAAQVSYPFGVRAPAEADEMIARAVGAFNGTHAAPTATL